MPTRRASQLVSPLSSPSALRLTRLQPIAISLMVEAR
jgi:hypothetical protein